MTEHLEICSCALIRDAGAADGDALARIYNHYILHTVATFEEQALPGAQMAARVQKIQCEEGLPWLVAERGGKLVGYAYATQWRQRSAYRWSTETAVYLEPDCCGRGTGTRLYEQLLGALRTRGMHLAIGGIALPNVPSVALHEKFGFEKVAQFREVGRKFERWIDVGYWQKCL